jgi:hypothetical protein
MAEVARVNFIIFKSHGKFSEPHFIYGDVFDYEAKINNI